MKGKLREYFTFTKGESKGILVLILLILCVAILNLLSDKIFAPPEEDFSEFEAQVAAFQAREEKGTNLRGSKSYTKDTLFIFDPNNTSDADWEKLGLSQKQIKSINKYLNKGGKFRKPEDLRKMYVLSRSLAERLIPYAVIGKNPKKTNRTSSPDSLFDFDPNILSQAEWQRLGFSEKQAISICKYVRAGGVFRKKEDLKKVYVVNEEKYRLLAPYIKIGAQKDQPSPTTTSEQSQESSPHPRIDLNNFSTADFNRLGGYWAKKAAGIIAYRKLLGGYAHKSQLLEVYGFSKNFYQKEMEFIDIDRKKIKTIKLNFAETKELAAHPYLSWEKAKMIIKHRNQNGAFKTHNDLLKAGLLTEKELQKISPYIKI